jgi:hypothetical protein
VIDRTAVLVRRLLLTAAVAFAHFGTSVFMAAYLWSHGMNEERDTVFPYVAGALLPVHIHHSCRVSGLGRRPQLSRLIASFGESHSGLLFRRLGARFGFAGPPPNKRLKLAARVD